MRGSAAAHSPPRTGNACAPLLSRACTSVPPRAAPDAPGQKKSAPASGRKIIQKEKSRRLPTFPHNGVSSARGCLTSVFGTGTGIATPPWPPAYKSRVRIRTDREKGVFRRAPRGRERGYGQGSRAISTARLCASPRLHLRPIDPVVYRGPSAGPRPEG